jgi:hypothetical protein
MDITLPFLWILNGFLAALYVLFENARILLLLPGLAWLYIRLPKLVGGLQKNVMRPGLLAASAFAILGALFGPMPAPWMFLLMILASCAAIRLEKFRPDEACWTFVQGVVLYALVVLGLAIFETYMREGGGGADALLSAGASYISVFAAIALWGYPLVYIGMLVKGLLAHAPLPVDPQQMIDKSRSRS